MNLLNNKELRTSVSSVFCYLFSNFKFLGTIEFLVSIYGKILVVLSPNLGFYYRSLYLNIAALLHLVKISPINL